MSYDPESCTVIYRSRMHKTLKRNFQVMHGADWMAQLCSHIPDRFEHLVRYAGWYSNRSRGKPNAAYCGWRTLAERIWSGSNAGTSASRARQLRDAQQS
jgi:hypothetical protein